jgi:hypothetical protein
MRFSPFDPQTSLLRPPAPSCSATSPIDHPVRWSRAVPFTEKHEILLGILDRFLLGYQFEQLPDLQVVAVEPCDDLGR